MVRPVVSEGKRATHNITLTDADGKTIGLIITDAAGHARPKGISRNPTPRTALKTRSGEMKFDSFNEPWSPIAQEDWRGGRANLEFDKDGTRFNDSFRANTQYGYFSNGPQEVYSTGFRLTDEELPGSIEFIPIKPGNYLNFASKRTLTETYTASYLYLYLKRKGTPPADLTITLESVDGTTGLPDTVLKTITITTSDITDVVSEYRRMVIPSDYSASSGTQIWIRVQTTTADEDNYWSVGMFDKTPSTAKYSPDGTTWTEAPYEMYFRMTPSDDSEVQAKLFKYRYTEFAVVSINGAAPKLFYNGDHGQADSNSAAKGTLIDATKSWPTDKFVGKVVKIVSGPGVTEWQNWRTITANDGTTLTVDHDWVTDHTTDTEYAILGDDSWTEIASGTHGLTLPVDTDPLVVDNIVYFCQNDDTVIRKMQWAIATLWTFQADTQKAYVLQQCRDASAGLQIWRGQNKDATGLISVSVASLPASLATNLSFGAAIPLKDERGRITGIEEYGDTTKVPWVMREGSIYQIVSSKPDEIPLREIATMMDTSNGRAHLVHNVYLYFNYGLGIERYYDKELSDVGPNRDLGLPTGRKGVVSCLTGYPGRFFAAIDAGADGISSVLVTNLSGWHEVYRAPAAGQRIRAMDFQTIPGETPDRLWVQVGNDIISLNFPSGGLDPLNDENSRYTHESTITGSRMYVSMYDVQKFFRSFKLYADNLSDGQTVEMDYRMDEDTAWSTVPGSFTGDVRELFPIEDYGVNGVSLTYRLRILTNDNSKTIRGKALVLNNISRVPVKYNYGFPYRVVSYDVNLQGKTDGLTATERQNQIDEWATELMPLMMRCPEYSMFDKKVVFIDPPALNPYTEHEERYIGKLTIIEI